MLAKKSGLQEVLISIGETCKSEHELQAEIKQRYVQFKKNTLYNSEACIGDFWQIISPYFLFSKFKANICTLICGRHRIVKPANFSDSIHKQVFLGAFTGGWGRSHEHEEYIPQEALLCLQRKVIKFSDAVEWHSRPKIWPLILLKNIL